MSVDIQAFLTARLDEDEAAARAATAGPWEAESHDYGTVHNVVRADEYAWVASEIREEDAAYIARFDPARVLAEVATRRAILALHIIGSRPEKWGDTRHHPDQDYPRTNYVGQPTGGTVYYCEICDDAGSEYGPGESDAYRPRALPGCETLLALVVPYADHPDCDPTWKIES